MKTAILVDGGYYRKRAQALWGNLSPEKRAVELITYCNAHLRHEKATLYRIFYYDCKPLQRNVYHPLLKKQIRLEDSPLYDWTIEFFGELTQKRKLALRLGNLSTTDIGYNLRQKSTKKLMAGTLTIDKLTENDFKLNTTQKGVDMRIGVDISSMAFKNQVDQMILIAGDSDFVPAAKMARREGVDFILDPMWQDIKEDLNEHIDGLRSPWKSNQNPAFSK